MSAYSTGGRSRRVGAAVAFTGILALVLLAVFLWPSARTKPAASTVAVAKPSLLQRVPLVPRRHSPSKDAEKSAGEQLADGEVVIDDVRVDKSEVCRGEEVVLSIHARTSNGGSPYLNFGVVGQPELTGPRIAMRVENTIKSGDSQVFARGKNGSATVAGVPPVFVKDCDAPLSLRIGYGRNGRMPDRAWLSAEPVASPHSTAPRFEPVSYIWDFGDGKTEQTSTAQVEHSYEDRLQDAAYSYFFVTVKARDAEGREIRGSRSLRFVNLGFDPRQSEITVFAGVDEGAKGGEAIWLYHGHSESVHIQRVTVTDESLDGAAPADTNAHGDAANAQEHVPTALLGFDELPAGTSRTVRSLAHLRPKNAAIVRIVRIFGESVDGTPASGAFDLLAESQPLAGAAHD